MDVVKQRKNALLSNNGGGGRGARVHATCSDKRRRDGKTLHGLGQTAPTQTRRPRWYRRRARAGPPGGTGPPLAPSASNPQQALPPVSFSRWRARTAGAQGAKSFSWGVFLWTGAQSDSSPGTTRPRRRSRQRQGDRGETAGQERKRASESLVGPAAPHPAAPPCPPRAPRAPRACDGQRLQREQEAAAG